MERSPGASLCGDECEVHVWAPRAKRVQVHWQDRSEPSELSPLSRGYFAARFRNVSAGSLYRLQCDDRPPLPDPASRRQPLGVHGPSEVVDLSYEWQDNLWPGLPLNDYVIYELHVGTFTPEGTFAAAIERLDALKSLGIRAVELMPISAFPGNRNWGYDGVYPYSVHAGYGSPVDLMRFVDECHARDLAVILDVVYNHLGPEGNYFGQFGDYFTERYRTPWGQAINFDGPQSDAVRHFFVRNALYWLEQFHIDALRLDAVHAIFDESARHFLEDLSEAVDTLSQADGRKRYLIEECDRNDPRHLAPRDANGLGLDGVWNDDFHHAVHTLLTGEQEGYYQDFGVIDDLAETYRSRFRYTGQYSPFRQRRHGADASHLAPGRFVVCVQNHDQVGNRAQGDRLNHLIDFASTKLAAGLLCMSPFVPLIFMGQEFNETSPFQYFTSHTDPQLIQAVRAGRREEFAAFTWQQQVPDPQAEKTFANSRLTEPDEWSDEQQLLWNLYRELLALRRGSPCLQNAIAGRSDASTEINDQVLAVHYPAATFTPRDGAPPPTHSSFYADELSVFFSFSREPSTIRLPAANTVWRKRIDSADPRWLGPGTQVPEQIHADASPELPLPGRSFVVFQREVRSKMCTSDA